MFFISVCFSLLLVPWNVCALRLQASKAELHVERLQARVPDPTKTRVMVMLHSPQKLSNYFSANTYTWPLIQQCWLEHFLNQTSFKSLELITLDKMATEHALDMVRKTPGAKGRVNLHIREDPDFHYAPAFEYLHANGSKKPGPEATEISLSRFEEDSELDVEEESEMATKWPTSYYMRIFFKQISGFLEKGEDVLHSDSDAVWVRDPWPALEKFLQKNSDLDLIAQLGDQQGRREYDVSLDTGFMYIRATDRSQTMFAELGSVMNETIRYIHTGEMQHINRYIFNKPDCIITNSKGERWVKDMENFAKKANYKEVMHQKYAKEVDELGLVGQCNHDIKFALLGPGFMRPGKAATSVVVHPSMSWSRARTDVYSLFKKMVRGVCK